MLCQTESDAAKVRKSVAKKNLNVWYEAYLLQSGSERHRRPKKVFCYISPKQLTIKEFYLKIIPKRLFTFRVCPATKVSLERSIIRYNILNYHVCRC